jgi:hypothetical protein
VDGVQRVHLGTPDLDSGASRHAVAALQTYRTLAAAFEALVAAALGMPEVNVATIHAQWKAEEQVWLDRNTF